MPTEAELRRRMQDGGPTTPIDSATVVRLARRRRLPRRIALGTAVSLAVVGIGVAGVAGVRGIGPMSASDSAGGRTEESAVEGYDPEGDDVTPVPAAEPATCGGRPAAGASSTGLEIGTTFPDTVTPDDGKLIGTVTVRNSGDTRITGTVTAPVFALLRDDVVVGYGDEPPLTGSAPLDLAPGEIRRYDSEVTPVGCSGDSALRPGAYELVAVIDFLPGADGTASGSTGRQRLTASEPLTVG